VRHTESQAAIDNLLYANDSGADPQVRIKKEGGDYFAGIVSSGGETASARDRKRYSPRAKSRSGKSCGRSRPVRTCAHAHAASAYRTVIKKTSPAGPQMCAVIAARRPFCSRAKNNYSELDARIARVGVALACSCAFLLMRSTHFTLARLLNASLRFQTARFPASSSHLQSSSGTLLVLFPLFASRARVSAIYFTTSQTRFAAAIGFPAFAVFITGYKYISTDSLIKFYDASSYQAVK